MMDIICIESATSTNNWVAEHEATLPSPSIVRCHTQSAGRGQRGNSWESEPGMNFTGTLLFHPKDFPATSQFMLSEAIALAVVNTLNEYGIEAKVKWPNDVYVGDKKISGILVEHVIMGATISRTLAGIGLNINQETFVSDAPNPTSMKLETGTGYDVDEVSRRLGTNLEKYLAGVKTSLLHYNNKEFNPGEEMESFPGRVHEEFMASLWRNDALYYPFVDKVKGEGIVARIAGVAPDGMLKLQTDRGEDREYAFKEIEFVI